MKFCSSLKLAVLLDAAAQGPFSPGADVHVPPSWPAAWPVTIADTLLEESGALGSAAHWVATTNAVTGGTNILTLYVPATGNGFFRVRQPQ